MKKSFDRPGHLFRLLLALALMLALVPFSCFGETAPAREATPEQIYADESWSFDFDEDIEFSKQELIVLRRLLLWIYNDSVADWCKEEAEKLPEESEVRKQYEEYEALLRQPQPESPSLEESKESSGKALSNISSQLKEEAVEYYKRCVEAEPAITADLFEIADSLGTEMYGIKYRLKSAGDNVNGVCRFADKIDEKMKVAEKAGHPISYKEAAESIHDLVRYTMAATPDTLVLNFKTTREKLEAKGYRYVKIKNSWESYSMNAPYRGVNTQIESPSGIVFELQFHTAESLVVKSIAHGMYEITRDPKIPLEEKVDLLKQSYELFDRMKAPNRISEIVPLS